MEDFVLQVKQLSQKTGRPRILIPKEIRGISRLELEQEVLEKLNKKDEERKKEQLAIQRKKEEEEAKPLTKKRGRPKKVVPEQVNITNNDIIAKLVDIANANPPLEDALDYLFEKKSTQEEEQSDRKPTQEEKNLQDLVVRLGSFPILMETNERIFKDKPTPYGFIWRFILTDGIVEPNQYNPRESEGRIIWNVLWDGIIYPEDEYPNTPIDIRKEALSTSINASLDEYASIFGNQYLLGSWEFNYSFDGFSADWIEDMSSVEELKQLIDEKLDEGGRFDSPIDIDYTIEKNLPKIQVKTEEEVLEEDYDKAFSKTYEIKREIDKLKKKLDKYNADEMELRAVLLKEKDEKKQLELFELVEDIIAILIPETMKELTDKERELALAEEDYETKRLRAIEYEDRVKTGKGISNPDLYEKAKKIVYKQYPKHSAYRSGQLVKKYKELGGTYSGKKPTKTGIARWFKEEWTDIGNKAYPVYRPTKRVSKETPLTASEIDPVQAKKQIALKQKIKGTSNLPAFQKAGGSIEQFSNPKKVQEKAKKYLGKDAVVYLSTKKEKKYMIKDPNNKWVHFGQMDYEDFTKHQDEKRRKNYLTRTANIKGDWKSNKYSPNNLSRNLLW